MRKRWSALFFLIFGVIFLASTVAAQEPSDENMDDNAPPPPPQDAPVKGTPPPIPGMSVVPGVKSFAPRPSWRTAPRRYIVKPGDTLWDISRRFLGSPWYWPQLWSKNPQIQNPHWIFPGDIIKFFNRGEITVEKKEKKRGDEWKDVSKADWNTLQSTDDIKWTPGRRAVSADDFTLKDNTIVELREGFIEQSELKKAGKVLGSTEARMIFAPGDVIYLKLKNPKNATVGEPYSIVKKGEPVYDPATNRFLGYTVYLAGIVQIIDIKKDQVLAKVKRAIREIEVGDPVVKFTPLRLRIKVYPNESYVKGYVLRATQPLSIYGRFYQILINKGFKDGIRVGNTFDIFRRGGLFRGNLSLSARKKYPREKIGQAIVIEVRRETCTAIVIKSILEIQRGDEVETAKNE